MSKAKAVAKKKIEEKVEPAEVCMVMPGNDLMTVLNLVNTVAVDAKVDFHLDGLKITVVDASHVAMVSLDYGNTDDDPIHRIAIDCKAVSEVLKKGLGKAKGRGEKRKSDYNLLFESDKVTGKYSVSDVDGQYTVIKTSMDLDSVVSPNIPTLEYKYGFEMPATKLLEKLEFCKLGSDLVQIEVFDDDVEIRSLGTEYTQMKAKGDCSSVTPGVDGREQCQYSLSYLIPIVKALKGQQVKVSTNGPEGKLGPIKIECDWDFGYETKSLKLMYMLAPRVEQDY